MPLSALKLIVFFLILFSLNCQNSVQADEIVKKDTLQNNLLVSPVGLAFAIWGFDFEKNLTENMTLGLGLKYFREETPATITRDFEYKGLATYYLRNRSGTPWIQAGIGFNNRYSYRKAQGRTVPQPRALYMLTGGYTWDFAEGFNVRLGAGASFIPGNANNLVQPLLVWQMGMYL